MVYKYSTKEEAEEAHRQQALERYYKNKEVIQQRNREYKKRVKERQVQFEQDYQLLYLQNLLLQQQLMAQHANTQ